MQKTPPPDELLAGIIRSLVDDPNDVRIDVHQTNHTAVFEVHVEGKDVGKVLGRGGEYADALRLLFSAIYTKHRMRLVLSVIDPRR